MSVVSRRAFLGTAASLALAGAARPGRAAPSRTIHLGMIGAGGIANAHLGPLLGAGDVRVVAVCDPNGQRREAMRQRVDQHYQAADCAGYVDFRELLAHDDLDAVLIGTPDNWHALQIIAAARAGKHIYSEKPFARTIVEGRAAVTAVEQAGVVFQHGTQQRSDDGFRLACELARSGRLGEIKRVTLAVAGGRQGSRGTPGPVPDWLDYDLWLGPAPEAPYSPERIESVQWFHMQEYSAGGYVSGWGIHHVDIAQWGLGRDDTGPVEVEGTAVYPTDGLCNAPISWLVQYRYADGPPILFASEDRLPSGVVFEGTEGTVHVNRGYFRCTPEHLAGDPLPPDAPRLYRSPNHHRNWLDGIHTGTETICPARVGHRAQTVCSLSDIALRLGRRIRWDPAAERILDDPIAARELARTMREPWSL